jgi:hypothetical protein
MTLGICGKTVNVKIVLVYIYGQYPGCGCRMMCVLWLLPMLVGNLLSLNNYRMLSLP